MSKKQWFILRVDHHLGPYSHEELIELYERAKLREVDQLWREGMDSWWRFDEIDEFSYLWAPPPLPDLPEEEGPPPLPPLPPEEEDELPPLPEQEDLPLGPRPETEPETEPELEVTTEATEEESKPSRVKWLVASALCLVVLSLGVMFLFEGSSGAPEFYEMRVKQAQEMKSFLKNNKGVFKTSDMPLALGLSRDSQSLVLAAPYSGNAQVFLRLESLENKGLFTSPIVVTAQSQLKNHKAVFEELTWEQGRSLAPGYYRYEVSAIPTGITAQLRGALQRAGLAQEAPTPFEGRGEVLLSRWKEAEFEKKWEEFQDKLLAEQMAPLEETLQRYQTLEGLADQILSLYKEVLPGVKKASDMRVFESRYTSEVGRLLQELIIQAHNEAQGLKTQSPSKSEALEGQRDFGKEVGGLVSDMVTTTQETPKLNKQKKERLIKLFENRVQSLTEQAQKRQQAIRQQIQDLRPSLND